MKELEDLYRRYGFILERRCTRILGVESDGRDAAHEAFARAASNLASFRGENERIAWLYRISTNVCLNVLRERRTRSEGWQTAVSDDMQHRVTDEESRVINRQDAVRLLGLAEDESTRALVLYVFVDGMSQEEAAGIIGISRATANTRLGRFREQARAFSHSNPSNTEVPQ